MDHFSAPVMSDTDINIPEHRLPYRWAFVVGLLLFFTLLVVGYYYTRPPQEFSTETIIEIPSGYTLDAIGNLLEAKSIIRSPLFFKLLVQHYGKEHAVPEGMYLFTEPLTVDKVAQRIAEGNHGISMVKVTLPEGMTRDEMADVFSRNFQHFVKEDFLNETQGEEGYLFPDTYFFYSIATSGPMILALEENFTQKTASAKITALTKEKNWGDIIILASILEKEAATALDRRIVAGILTKRLEQGMRLQVDATFMYTVGKSSRELTAIDLAKDSPYNTYRHAGLPLGPISNPGRDAIDAAITPIDSPYFYYLSDKNGIMHYAKTFTEHKLNKKKYLE